MTDDDDVDGLAAEYVVGSLDPAERAQVAARCRTDVTLREAIGDWERRLGTLADGVPGIEPPAHLYSTIAKRIWGQGARRSRGQRRPRCVGALGAGEDWPSAPARWRRALR
jgi:anti-sigma-K factor RskA